MGILDVPEKMQLARFFDLYFCLYLFFYFELASTWQTSSNTLCLYIIDASLSRNVYLPEALKLLVSVSP